ncbi:DUF3962 domain-containing protein [Kitasatospora sp. NBC_01250]|uniref:pPIWI_RE module domain-containing protein n=1 Tax=Kitasatospora sp. NBC_01250 TaxID=2903571 RepID=UPI002E3014E9|nr:DUF3962 domain-containing protein [Kitasatospora sp. NBC_01250]
MAYDSIQPAAFVPDPSAGPFYTSHHALTFPAAWRRPILDLYRHGKPEKSQAKIKNVPIRKLNQAMRAVAPDLVAVDATASFDAATPWLYADAEYPPAVMDTFIHAWLRDMQPSPEAYSLFKDTVRSLDTRSLRWNLVGIDMLQQSRSEGGTAMPAPHLYRLLTETLAARIARLQPYEHGGERLHFRQVAGDARANGAELVSWPPLEEISRTKDDGQRVWHYSAVLRVSLRTVPFSPIPRLHLGAGIRRWVNGPVWLPSEGSASTFLLADSAFVADAPAPARFAVAQLAWDRKTRKTGWAHGGPEGLLPRLSALDNLPSPDVLAKEPETWIAGRDGVTAAVVHHTMMGRHAIGAGLMPSERRRLVEWAGQALEPEFKPVGALRRSSIKRQTPTRVLERNASVPKEGTDAELAEIAALNEQVAMRNAGERRSLVAAAVGRHGLSTFLLYQSDAMRDHLIRAAESSLNLSEYRVESGPSVWSWEAPELTVRIHARPLGALGAPLGDERAPRKGAEQDQAIRDRRTETSAFLRQLSQSVDYPGKLTFVELDGKDAFKKRTTDPKFALRLGCADADTVSQFIRPRDPEAADEKDDSGFRAAASWADGLRQLGVRFVPQHTLGDIIPTRLNQVAFWLVKRQHDGPTYYTQFTPIAILVRPGQDCVMGRSADMQSWVPYPELLKALTGKIRPEELKTAQQQSDATAAFVRTTLYQMRGEPTLVVTHAQNTRYRWPWLQNNGLVQDRIQIGGGPLQRLALQGKQLRIVRVATSDRDETPEWWAPKPEGRGGIAKGLWVPEGEAEADRVFYSTTDKASTHTLSVDAAKLTPHLNAKGKSEFKPRKNAWNPELLEFAMVGLQAGDSAEDWAMYLHQQRFSEDYRDGLGLPLILHLAELTSDYALPHAEAEKAGADTEASPDQPEQLSFDLFSEGEALD